MPDNVPIIDANGTSRPIAADEVTDGALGTVDVQYLKIMDGTLNGTNKAGVGSDGGLLTTFARPSTSSVTSVSGSVTSVNLLASNAAAKVRKLFNESTATLYVKDGTTASVTSYSVQVPPGGYYEWPQPCWTGNVDGIWSAANGAARITEQS